METRRRQNIFKSLFPPRLRASVVISDYAIANLPMLILTTPASAFMQINFLLVLGTVTGLVLFFKGFGLLQRKRLIQDIPRCTIRSAALGLVELSGTATGDSTLLSPLCQLDCLFYQITAWTLTGGDQYRHWKKVAEESLSVPFFIEDNTGRMLVDAKGADLQISPDYSEEYGGTSRGTYGRAAAYVVEPELSVPEAVGHFLARHGISPDAAVKVEERSVKTGDRLFIVGTVCENTSAQVETEVAARSSYLSASAADLQRSVVLDSVLSRAEQKLIDGRQTETRAAPEPRLAPAPQIPVVLMKGTNNPVFLISTFSQQELLGELRWKTPLYIFGGPALTLFCLWNLFVRFGVL